MDKKEVFDKAFDEMLYYAASLAAEKMLEELPEYEEVEFSDRHKAMMEKLFKKERRKLFFKNFIKYSKRAAVFAIAAVIGISISIYSVEAWRIKVLNTIIEMRDTHGQISFSGQGERSDMPDLSIGYVPNGFECTRNDNRGGGHIFRMYEYENKHFRISILPAEGQMAFDTEGAIVSDVEINGKKGILSDMSQTSKKFIILVWYDDTYCYSVSGNISKEEIFKVAENTSLK